MLVDAHRVVASISPYVSPISPYISLYLRISPYISVYLDLAVVLVDAHRVVAPDDSVALVRRRVALER